MKNVLWFLLLAAVAVVAALLLGDNQAIVSVFWPPWRIDLSLNLVLIGLLLGFVLLHLALRGIALLRTLPQRAQRWRQRQQEKAVYVGLLEALVQHWAGRFVRAQTSAEQALQVLERLPEGTLAHQGRWLLLARLLLAESAHSLGNTGRRDATIEAALAGAGPDAAAAREAALLRASAWAIEARDAVQARHWWQQLPQGAARRIQALRLRLKLAQLERDSLGAIEMVRQLKKHKAFSNAIATRLLHTLVGEALQQTHDAEQLLRVWKGLDARERADAGLALEFLQQGLRVWPQGPEGGDGVASVAVAMPLPEAKRWRDEALQTLLAAYPQLEGVAQRRSIRVLQDWLPALDGRWLVQLDAAQAARPADAGLQYLCGLALLQRQLWGKAGQMLQQASRSLQDAGLRRRAWRALAQLAEQRGDEAAAQQAWKQAAACAEAGL